VPIFEDEAAEEVHTTSKAVDRFTGILYPETVDGVAFDRSSPVGPA
jgi:hypothetical protein